MIDTHFPELTPYEDTTSPIKEKSETKMVISNGVYFRGRLVDVQEDDAVRLLIDSFSEDTPSLAIVGECMNQFGEHYNKMQFSDWGKIVRLYLNRKYGT